MPKVTASQIESMIFQGGRLFVPKRIERAIERCVTGDVSSAQLAGKELIKEYDVFDKPVNPDYCGEGKVDGYTLYYTRRNTLVPRVALRDLCLNRAFQSFPAKVRVLDLGSGTGAVSLGLLDLFYQSPLDSVHVEIDAVDVSKEFLNRMELLLAAADLDEYDVNPAVIDLTNVGALRKFLAQREDYDLVFAANVFIEMQHQEAIEVVECVARHLTGEGVIVIANAERDFGKELISKLATASKSMGLSVYYPCPPGIQCSQSRCWFWREHSYDCAPSLNVQGTRVRSSHREQLVAHWLMLCRNNCSIYDDFIDQYQQMDWGVLSIFGTDTLIDDSQICTTAGMKTMGKQVESIRRGSIVGGTGDPFIVQQYVKI